MYDVNLSGIRTIADVDVTNAVVLVRADLNVPMEAGQVTDTTRLDRFAPTLQDLAARRAKVVVLSHFGRPEGSVVPAMSLRAVAGPLGQSVGREVDFGETDWDDVARLQHEIAGMAPGDILLAENTRFHPGETDNAPDLARRMAGLGTIFVNDAFSAAHRAHASTVGIADYLPAYAGPSLAAEIDAIRSALDAPKRPVGAVVGGAKVSSKLPVLVNLVERLDALIIGGGMANTFLHALGHNVGKSLCEPEFADTARDILAKAKEAGCAVHLPVDAGVAPQFEAGAPVEYVGIDDVPGDQMILDVGPQTRAQLDTVVAGLETLLWNGPLGAFEIAPFDVGTNALAKSAGAQTAAGRLRTVAGGGDTVAALNHAGAASQFSYISTAGGAFLEWLEGRHLPGILALTR
ncbi:MAG: phosphoglycerate kinase [Pseudomonadota bacterium]